MIESQSPYPIDYLYIKVAGAGLIHWLPLCEAYTVIKGVSFDPKQSDNKTIVMVEMKENGKSVKYEKSEFRALLQAHIYNDKQKIVDFIIQPEGEMRTPEVTAFLENKQ